MHELILRESQEWNHKRNILKVAGVLDPQIELVFIFLFDGTFEFFNQEAEALKPIVLVFSRFLVVVLLQLFETVLVEHTGDDDDEVEGV